MTAIDVFLVAASFVTGAAIDSNAARFARGVASDHAESMLATKLLSGFAGAMAALLAVWFAPHELRFFAAAFGLVLLALSNIDLRIQLLPNILTAALFVLGTAMVILVQPEAWLMHTAGAVFGFAVLWAVETGYKRLRGRDGLGRGDAKLLGAIGMWVGLAAIPPVLLLASLSGLAAALIQSSLNKTHFSAATTIAFGPWIAFGGLAVWYLQVAGH